MASTSGNTSMTLVAGVDEGDDDGGDGEGALAVVSRVAVARAAAVGASEEAVRK